MKTYAQFRPTPFDRSGASLPDRQHWFVAPVSRNRDSVAIDESNFATFLYELEGESNTIEVHRFDHWACGWFEVILIDPSDSARVLEAERMEQRLEDHPALDESDWFQRRWEAAMEDWSYWGERDFLRDLGKVLEAWAGDLEHPKIAPMRLSEVIDTFYDLSYADILPTLPNCFSPASYLELDGNDEANFQIDRLIKSIDDLNPLFDLCADRAWAARKSADQRKVAALLGLTPEQTAAALRRDLTSVSAMRALATT